MNAVYRQKKATIDEAHNPNKYASKTVVTMDDDDDILSHHTKGLSKMTLIGINPKSEADFPTLGGAPKTKPAVEADPKKQANAWGSKPTAPQAAWGGVVQPPTFPSPSSSPVSETVVPPAFPPSRTQPQPPVQQPQFHPANPVSAMPTPVYQYQQQPTAPAGAFAPHVPMRYASLLIFSVGSPLSKFLSPSALSARGGPDPLPRSNGVLATFLRGGGLRTSSGIGRGSRTCPTMGSTSSPTSSTATRRSSGPIP